MGLRDDIQTLEARFENDESVGQELAKALATMITRKASKHLIQAWFEDLAEVLQELGRYEELVDILNVDPEVAGPWNCQEIVKLWLAKQP